MVVYKNNHYMESMFFTPTTPTNTHLRSEMERCVRVCRQFPVRLKKNNNIQSDQKKAAHPSTPLETQGF